MMLGLGDWFEPDCTPGDPGCVPHWYCYIPGAATPDCLKSFGQGVSEIAEGVTAPVIGGVTAAATGVASGLGSGVAGISSGAVSGLALLAVVVAVGSFVFAHK